MKPLDNPYKEEAEAQQQERGISFWSSPLSTQTGRSLTYDDLQRWSSRLWVTTHHPPPVEVSQLMEDFTAGRISKANFKRRMRKLRRAAHAASVR